MMLIRNVSGFVTNILNYFWIAKNECCIYNKVYYRAC